jgi:hypothetical protein
VKTESEKVPDKISEQMRSISRFPVAAAVCLGAAALSNLDIAGLLNFSDQLRGELTAAGIAVFLAGLAAALWLADLKLSVLGGLIATIVAAAAAAALQFSHGARFAEDVPAVVGLVAAVLVVRHLRRGAAVAAFWLFDLHLAIAAGIGFAAYMIICLGLSALLASAHYLFDLRIGASLYEHIWATGATLIGPVVGLAGIPLDANRSLVTDADASLIEKGVRNLLSFALAPLILVYALMLHLYAIKIAFFTTMPKGEVGWLVTTFGIVGTLAYMSAYPWRANGSRLVRWLMRSWFFLMIVPTILLSVAVWQRIAQHGVTPDRFYLSLFALWIWSMILYFGLTHGRIDLRAIPASTAIVLILISIGPWSAHATSVRSQVRQFRRIALAQHLALKDGRLPSDPTQLLKFIDLMRTNEPFGSAVKTLKELDALNLIAADLSHVKDPKIRQMLAVDLGAELVMPLTGSGGQKVAAAAPAGTETVVATAGKPAAATMPTAPLSRTEPHAVSFVIQPYRWLVGPVWVDKAGGIRNGDAAAPVSATADIQGMPVSFSTTILSAGHGASVVSFDLAGVMRPAVTLPQFPIMVPAIEGKGMIILVRPGDVVDPKASTFEVWLLLGNQPGIG